MIAQNLERRRPHTVEACFVCDLDTVSPCTAPARVTAHRIGRSRKSAPDCELRACGRAAFERPGVGEVWHRPDSGAGRTSQTQPRPNCTVCGYKPKT